jgi:hypothetical protein
LRKNSHLHVANYNYTYDLIGVGAIRTCTDLEARHRCRNPPLRQLRPDGTAPSSLERLVPSRRSLPIVHHKLLIIKYESKVVIVNRHFEQLRDQFKMAIHNQQLGLALDYQ